MPPAWAVEEPTIATLLQNGLYAEEAQGNLRSAIEIYQGIIAREDANRALVAQAQFRLGACHRKLGELDAAVVAFRRVIDRFAVKHPAHKRLAFTLNRLRPAHLRRVLLGPLTAV